MLCAEIINDWKVGAGLGSSYFFVLYLSNKVRYFRKIVFIKL